MDPGPSSRNAEPGLCPSVRPLRIAPSLSAVCVELPVAIYDVASPFVRHSATRRRRVDEGGELSAARAPRVDARQHAVRRASGFQRCTPRVVPGCRDCRIRTRVRFA